MTRPESALHVEVLDDEFVITMPGTSYKVTFRKLADGPGLILALHTKYGMIRTLLSLGRSFLPALGESPMIRRASWGGSFRTRGKRSTQQTS